MAHNHPADAAVSVSPAHWESLRTEQNNVFHTLFSHNQSMLEDIVSLQARLKKAEEDLQRYQKHIHSLEEELVKLKDGSATALCVVDGDGYVPHVSFLRDGKDGGRRAAACITQHILDNVGRRCSLYTVVYVNKKGLADTLVANGVCSQDNFEQYIVGFNQASPLFSIVDVGKGKEAADIKLRELLKLFAHFPQTKKIFFGGGHDNGYATLLRSLDTEGVLNKVTLIRCQTQMGADIKNMRLPMVTFEGLFADTQMHVRPGTPQRHFGPPHRDNGYNNRLTLGSIPEGNNAQANSASQALSTGTPTLPTSNVADSPAGWKLPSNHHAPVQSSQTPPAPQSLSSEQPTHSDPPLPPPGITPSQPSAFIPKKTFAHITKTQPNKKSSGHVTAKNIATGRGAGTEPKLSKKAMQKARKRQREQAAANAAPGRQY